MQSPPPQISLTISDIDPRSVRIRTLKRKRRRRRKKKKKEDVIVNKREEMD
jgi:hypothetical protein